MVWDAGARQVVKDVASGKINRFPARKCFLVRPATYHARERVKRFLVRPATYHARERVKCFLVRPATYHARVPF